jgi:transcriptional regulator with XRE-family HTH domain
LSSQRFVFVGDRIAALRRAAGRARGRRLTQRELAHAVGVHLATVTAWEIGKQRPEGDNLLRLAGVLGVPPSEVVGGDPSPPPPAAGALEGVDPGDAALELFGSLDRLVRYVEGVAPPGQATLRKLDALEGLRRLLTARGPLPDWWHLLRERVESGAL